MPNRSLTLCKQAGCGRTVRGVEYCEQHVLNNSVRLADLARNDDPIRRMYQSSRWRTYRAWFIDRQSTCQKIVSGVRCDRPPTEIHHLRSPRVFPAGFVDPTNTVALCKSHHPSGVAGTPEWRVNVDYAPSVTKSMKIV
jgi:hypothetical protein